jgi:hypothetical protein
LSVGCAGLFNLGLILLLVAPSCRYKGDKKEKTTDKSKTRASTRNAKGGRPGTRKTANGDPADASGKSQSGQKQPRQEKKKYVLQRKSPLKKGDQYMIDYKFRMINRHTFTIEETKTRRGAEDYKVRYKALATVDKVTEKGTPQAATHEVLEWTVRERQKRLPERPAPAGTKIKINLKKGMTRFKVKGHRVKKFNVLMLDNATLVQYETPGDSSLVLPPEPQPVGATWTIDPAKANKIKAPGNPVKLIEGEGKLVAITEIDDVPCLEIETKLKKKGGKFYNFVEGVRHFKPIEKKSTTWQTFKWPVKGSFFPIEVSVNHKSKIVLQGRATLRKLLNAGKRPSRFKRSLKRRFRHWRRRRGRKGKKQYQAVHTVHIEQRYTLKVTEPKTKIGKKTDDS